ncbi:MAG: guanylate kinase [Bacillota bacterium]|jgi:guanylate kinase
MSRGRLFVITAPSGCGKGSLRRALMAKDGMLTFCPSVTTRAPRAGEADGVDYFFVSREEFLSMKDQGGLAEWAEVYGNLYGTPGKAIDDALESGRDVILEKDVQGARTLREAYPEGVFVFVLPPSVEELRRRICGRGTETPDQLEIRLRSATEEMSDLKDYDYVIINSDLDRAVERLLAIVAGERARFQEEDA